MSSRLKLIRISEMESQLKGMFESQNMLLGDQRQLLGFVNRLYSFIASNPAFNAVDGTGEKDSNSTDNAHC